MRAYDVVSKLQDLTDLEWSESVQTSASGGTFLKARRGQGASSVYYKLSCYDAYRGVYGHECVNELLAARVMGRLGIPCADCRLLHARAKVDGVLYETWVSSSKSFRKTGEKKIAFDQFFDLNHKKGESQLGLMERYGWRKDFERITVADYLIGNRDRHGANIEVLRSRSGELRLAPAFDNGVSLLFSCQTNEEVAAFDVMSDIRANNYVGTKSLYENLSFTSFDCIEGELRESDKEYLLAGLDDALSEEHREAVWDMVYGRWCEYARVRDLRHD